MEDNAGDLLALTGAYTKHSLMYERPAQHSFLRAPVHYLCAHTTASRNAGEGKRTFVSDLRLIEWS